MSHTSAPNAVKNATQIFAGADQTENHIGLKLLTGLYPSDVNAGSRRMNDTQKLYEATFYLIGTNGKVLWESAGQVPMDDPFSIDYTGDSVQFSHLEIEMHSGPYAGVTAHLDFGNKGVNFITAGARIDVSGLQIYYSDY